MDGIQNFQWGVDWKPSEILYSLLEALKANDDQTVDLVNALAFAIGQVVALEMTSTLKLKGRDNSTANKHEPRPKGKAH